MNFKLSEALQILEKTPDIIICQLANLSSHWIHTKEYADTWSVFDIIGHLLHGEKTDWINRIDIILAVRGDKTFTPFDRFAQLNDSKGKSISDLLKEFKSLRKSNLSYLISLNLSESDFLKTGIHPSLGMVTLHNLLSTWVAHDLNHLSQITRVMIKRYIDDVGPWKEYLPLLNK